MVNKIAFVASSGGHLEEISQLKKIEEKYDNFLITEKTGFENKSFGRKQYYVSQINRKEILFPIKYAIMFGSAIRILTKEKPDVIITTGALMCFPFCVIAKYMGKKVVYIESFARVKEPSLTGKFMKKYSDLFIVQWEDMLEVFPQAVLGGGIF